VPFFLTKSLLTYQVGRHRPEKCPLLQAIVLTTKWSLLAILLPRLCLSAVKLTQPLLTSRITSWLGEHTRDNDTGKGLIAATTLIYLVMALFTVVYKRQTDRFLTTLRGILISALHSQSLACFKTQLSVSDGNMLTLVNTDVLRIAMSLQRIGEMFAAPFEVIGVTALLAKQSGISCIAPIAVGIIVPIMSAFNTKRGLPMQRLWLDSIQRRIAYTSAVLGCSKGFKMLGLTEFLSKQIQRLRLKELADYAGYRKFIAARETIASVPRALGPTLGLMMFTLINGSDKLTPSVAFSTLSLLSLLSAPIEEVVQAIIDLQLAYASILRIQAFLLNDDGDNSMSSFDPNDASSSVEMTARTSHGVSLSDATIFAGNSSQRPILQDISLVLQKGSFTLVLGPVGSGKSALLRAVMADLKLDAGSRSVSKDFHAFAFCSQEPWLPNDSIRNVILGESDYDSTWYTTVVQACALTIDIARLSAGEQTPVGDKGMSLSGGQKQRLALARALYSRIPILVLDDIFSGLDIGSLRHIAKSVFGPSGIAKRHGLTVLMATHQGSHFVQQADQIAVFGRDGRIVEQGSCQELVSNRISFLHTIELREEKFSGDQPEETNDAAVTLNTPIEESDDTPVSARRTGEYATYVYWSRSFGLKLCLLFLATTLSAGFSWKFMEVWVQWWSDAAISPPVASRHSLGYWIGWHITFALLALLFDFAKFWTILVWAVPHSSAQLHQQILRTVMNAPYWFFVKTNLGSIVNRFSNDMALIESAGAGPILLASETLTMLLGSAALILAGSSYASATLPFLLVAVYLLQRFYLRTSRQLRYMDLETQAPLINAIQESMYGVSTIRAFGWQSASHQKFLDLLDHSQRPYYLLLCIQRWLGLMLDILTAVIATVVVSLAISMPSTSSASSLGLALLNVLGFNSQLSAFVVAWTTIETSASAVSRCREFEQTTPDERLPMEIADPYQNWPREGKITIQDLRATYTPDGPNVLHGIDLRIAPGAKIGICGRSGSGKSSFLLSLFRMLENMPVGSISIDNVDLATLPRSVLRERLTAVPQETLIIPGSMRENMDPLKTSNVDDINSALEKVGLASLVADRGGIETDMTDVGLSQGELQLFAVARALLRPSKVLVVDEMTSSMDHLSEKKVLDLVRTEFEGSTVLAVAHRLATIVDFDMVVVLDEGRLVESGQPQELLQKSDGHFKRMWDQQESQDR
jgi:ATP-binding cassette subfamily C (CFTR/MRP) protein 1